MLADTITTLRSSPGQTLLGIALGLTVGYVVPQFSFHGGVL